MNFESLPKETSLLTIHTFTACTSRQEMNGRLEEIFSAAKEGLYKSRVDVFLRLYGLPGSVTDTEGRSLLHYVTSFKGPHDAPVWSAKNVLKLIEDHNCLPNAVDYQGENSMLN